MDLKKYFEETQGLGILATADSQGHVNTEIGGRP